MGAVSHIAVIKQEQPDQMDRENLSISIDEVHEDEIDELLSLYVDLFHDREPLTKCVGLGRERMASVARSMYERSCFAGMLCWMARDRAGANRNAGFIVCDDPAVSNVHQLPEDLAGHEMERVSALGALMEEVRGPIAETLKRGEGLTIHIAAIGVAPGYEGKGIARLLLQTALSAARNRGFQYAFSECTSNASRMLHEKCGFEHLKSASLREAVAEEGRRPFADCDVDVHLMWKVLENGGA